MTLTADRETPQAVNPSQSWLEQAVQQHWGRVHAILYHLVGDEEAEDLALEAFWQLYQRQPRLADAGSLSGWLYRVATNLGFNALRARKRRQVYERRASDPQLPGSQEGDPASRVEQEIERQNTRQALAQMSARSAQILMLRHTGLSYAEIAMELGVGANSIGTLLARAERDFEKHYQRLAGQPEERQADASQ